jgi:ABC-type polar amino acid transport system ATPase subunit
MLEAKNLWKQFNGVKVLCDVSLTVETNKIVALIGPNGAGKSTLLRALAFLDLPDEGTISVDGRSYSFPSDRERYNNLWPDLTMVFQQLFLWPHLTLRENISLPAKKRKILDYAKRLQNLINIFDMADFVDRYPNETSLGQRQRAALARAVIINPRYLLLDEITSALDVEQATAVLTHLQTLKGEGMGILLVTHLLGFARRAANQIIFLDKGQVLETGSPDLIIAPTKERIKRFLDMYKISSEAEED